MPNIEVEKREEYVNNELMECKWWIMHNRNRYSTDFLHLSLDEVKELHTKLGEVINQEDKSSGNTNA